jgi:hypothetical protein
MALTKEDLHTIEQIMTKKLDQKLNPIDSDLKEIKSEVKFLAALNQREEIKKDPRMKHFYEVIS